MEKRLPLAEFGPRLWTRPRAVPVRERAEALLAALAPGDVLVVDAAGVEVFDHSFAAELFGKTILALPRDHPGRFFAVEHLSPYARENLETTLNQLNLAIIELVDGRPRLLGRSHLADEETLTALYEAGEPVAVAELRDRLGLTTNATNERLAKLVGLGLVRRERARSPAGREQFVYRVLA